MAEKIAETSARNALAALPPLIEAARTRLDRGHNDTCGRMLVHDTDADCDCGHDALADALSTFPAPPDTSDGGEG
jgi:hypothetical protein